MHHERQIRGGRNQPARPVSEEFRGAAAQGILQLLRSKGVREAVESIVIAFALAFLFRTFEAEAFVIPTGSMAPKLWGRHRDVDCPQCHFPYRVSASDELNPETDERLGTVFAGTCPQCGYTACIEPETAARYMADMNRDPDDVPIVFNTGANSLCQSTSPIGGDRILVSKFVYDFSEPRRWDVFVFRYPHDASKNYIKRLIGRPGETVRIHRGDIFIAPYDASAFPRDDGLDYHIERKPPAKVRAMMQLVYDNDYSLAELTRKGWPTAWTAWPRGASPHPGAWQSRDGARSFATDGSSSSVAWIRYQHLIPSFDDWEELLDPRSTPREIASFAHPQLITDTYAYNSAVARIGGREVWADPMFLGLNWVRDLVLQCELTVEKPAGTAVLELVAGGVRFQCRFDLATGRATLAMAEPGNKNKYVFSDRDGTTQRELVADTPVRAAGSYRLCFANVDQELHLWVNEELIRFPARATYHGLDNVIPRSDGQGGLDLAPVGVGSLGAALRVDRLRVSRDVYYIAARPDSPDGEASAMLEYPLSKLPQGLLRTLPRSRQERRLMEPDIMRRRAEFLSTPDLWPAAFANLRSISFPLARDRANPAKDQFLALGDNSPRSKDGRLWHQDMPKRNGLPQYYVERELLIGKALLTYWPITHWEFVR